MEWIIFASFLRKSGKCSASGRGSVRSHVQRRTESSLSARLVGPRPPVSAVVGRETFTTDGWFSAAIGFSRGEAGVEFDFRSITAIRLRSQVLVLTLWVRVNILCSLKSYVNLSREFSHIWWWLDLWLSLYLSVEYWWSKTFTALDLPHMHQLFSRPEKHSC